MNCYSNLALTFPKYRPGKGKEYLFIKRNTLLKGIILLLMRIQSVAAPKLLKIGIYLFLLLLRGKLSLIH